MSHLLESYYLNSFLMDCLLNPRFFCFKSDLSWIEDYFYFFESKKKKKSFSILGIKTILEGTSEMLLVYKVLSSQWQIIRTHPLRSLCPWPTAMYHDHLYMGLIKTQAPVVGNTATVSLLTVTHSASPQWSL